MTLNELFKNTTYDDTLFSAEDKSAVESRIFMKSVRGAEVPYITCAIPLQHFSVLSTAISLTAANQFFSPISFFPISKQSNVAK